VKKFFGTLFGLVVVAALAVVVVPSFVDWNGYKGDITSRVEQATGRTFTIDGDIRLAVLPKPSVTVHKVAFGNMEGASAPEMARLESLEVRIALAPLLSGQVRVETVRLVKPVISLEKLADGRANWQLQIAGGDAAAAEQPATAGDAASSAPPIALDNFSIVDGIVDYRDAKAGTIERVEAINATVAAASLSGPFESSGSVRARSLPITYSVNVGEVIQGRTVPFNLRLGAAGNASKLQVVGTLLGLEDTPRFKGKLKGEGDNLAILIATATGVAAPAPKVLGRPFSLEAEVAASAVLAEVTSLAISLGDIRAKGDVTAEMGDVINAAVQLSVGKVDLDALMAPPKPPTPAKKEAAGDGSAPKPAAKPAPPAKPVDPSAPLFQIPAFELPKNVSASLVANVEAITVKGGLVRNAILNAELANGEVTLSQLSAQFPGGTDVALFGFLSNSGGAPRFEGELETIIGDFRGVAAWLGVDLKGIPSDRLRKVALAAEVDVRPAETNISNLDLKFDGSRLTGGIVLAHRQRPSIGAGLALDRINVDAYLGKPDPAAKPVANPFQGLQALTTFDANIKAKVKSLTVRGQAAKDVNIDMVLHNSKLDIRNLSIADFAGAKASVKGKIKGLNGVPEAEKLRLALTAKNTAALFRLAGVVPPVPPKALGAVSVAATVDGGLLKPAIDTTLKAAGGQVDAKGRVSLLPVKDMVDLQVSAGHANTLKLLKLFGSKYRPAGKIGGFKVSGRLTGNPSQVNLSALKGRVGAIDIVGTVQAALAGARPKVTADLVTGPVNVNPFLPAKKTASLERWGNPRVMPVAFLRSVPTDRAGASSLLHRTAAPKGLFPTDAIDLSALGLADADLKLRSPSLRYQDFKVEGADLKARVSNGKLLLDSLTGKAFNGTLKATGSVDSKAGNALTSIVNIAGLDLANLRRATAGKADASGKLSLDLNLAGGAASVKRFVETMGGKGAVKIAGINPTKLPKGGWLKPIALIVSPINTLAKALKGKFNQQVSTDLTGTFDIKNGRFNTQDFKVASELATETGKGWVDLPKWALDVTGAIKMEAGLVSQLLGAGKSSDPIGFQVKGSLDKPKIKVDVAKLLLTFVPGGNELLKKVPGPAQGLLQGILGGGAPKTTQPQQQQPQQQPQQQQQPEPTPEKKLEETIKKGLGGLLKKLPF